ncbi:hypothetical protein FA13DRAFT_1239987 [Coprinellus micaceus]|uniref:Uncharacterized protein n=1 Tax=Coprinellus micaceus TaxID=71717 RepID=A0A4Y7TQS3_COPMI|nr:hypothetical protein FA13DRAFT_1239987 [Coprinellus micaceus]
MSLSSSDSTRDPVLADHLSSMVNLHLKCIRFTPSPPFTLPSDLFFDLPNVERLVSDTCQQRVVYIDVERFLLLFPRQLESFSASRMDVSRFEEVVLSLRPRAIAFAYPFDRVDEQVNDLVLDIVHSQPRVTRIEEFSIYNGSRSDAFLDCLFIPWRIRTVTTMILKKDHPLPTCAMATSRQEPR